MQREILEANETTDLSVYAVWVPFSGGTEQAASVSERVMPDSRVIHYWDEESTTSFWFAENVDDTLSPVWDVYYLYGPDAEWTDDPGPLISSGGTIIGRSSELQKAITPLLTS